MSPNHHRYANVLPIARLILVVAVVFCVSSACIYFVWCRNQIDASGRSIKEAERKLADIRSRSEVAQAKIIRLASMNTLQQKFRDGTIKLQKIEVYEPTMLLASDGDEVRTISNPKRSTRP